MFIIAQDNFMSHTIKGFTTKKDIKEQLQNAGIVIKLPFRADGSLVVEKNPFEGNQVLNCDNEPQSIIKQ